MNLLVHQAALGDWVLTFPILRHLSQSPEFQGQTLAIAAPSSKAKLAQQWLPPLQIFDADAPDWSRLFADLASNISAPPHAHLLRQTKLILSFVTDGQDAWARNIHQLAPQAKLIPIQPRPPHDWTRHVTAWHQHQARSYGLNLRDWEIPRRQNATGPIVIHPGSGGSAKCWPPARWEKIIPQLQSQNLPVLPILGEVELATWPRDQIHHWLTHLNARQILSLTDLYHLLQSARLYIGNDAGPTHLAAQMGLLTLALFGPTNPQLWQPLGPQVFLLAPPQPQPMTWLSNDQLLQHIHTLLKFPAAPASPSSAR